MSDQNTARRVLEKKASLFPRRYNICIIIKRGNSRSLSSSYPYNIRETRPHVKLNKKSTIVQPVIVFIIHLFSLWKLQKIIYAESKTFRLFLLQVDGVFVLSMFVDEGWYNSDVWTAMNLFMFLPAFVCLNHLSRRSEIRLKSFLFLSAGKMRL